MMDDDATGRMVATFLFLLLVLRGVPTGDLVVVVVVVPAAGGIGESTHGIRGRHDESGSSSAVVVDNSESSLGVHDRKFLIS